MTFQFRPFGIGFTDLTKEDVKKAAVTTASTVVGCGIIAVSKSLEYTANGLVAAADVVTSMHDGFIAASHSYCEKSTPVAQKTNLFLHTYAEKCEMKRKERDKERMVKSHSAQPLAAEAIAPFLSSHHKRQSKALNN